MSPQCPSLLFPSAVHMLNTEPIEVCFSILKCHTGLIPVMSGMADLSSHSPLQLYPTAVKSQPWTCSAGMSPYPGGAATATFGWLNLWHPEDSDMLMYFCIFRWKHLLFPLRLSVVVTPLQTRFSHAHPYIFYLESERDFMVILQFLELFNSWGRICRKYEPWIESVRKGWKGKRQDI